MFQAPAMPFKSVSPTLSPASDDDEDGSFLSPAGGGRDGDDQSQIPIITDEEEQRELYSLTVREIIEANADLCGLETGVSTLNVSDDAPRMSGGDATACTTTGSSRSAGTAGRSAAEEDALKRLNEELSKLPLCKTAVYAEALRHYPHLVDRDFHVSFLEVENYDARLAAKRIAKYWSFKLDVFGPDKCFMPIHLGEGGALRDEVDEMMMYSPVQLLPGRDVHGRAVLYCEPARRDVSKFSTKQEIRTVWHVLQCAYENSDVRRCGIIFVGNLRGLTRKNYDRKKGPFMRQLMSQVLPTRIRAIHMCHASPMAHVVFPVMKFAVGRAMRLRLRIHSGPDMSVLQGLQTYGLPVEIIPRSLGGHLDTGILEWVSERLMTEGLSSVTSQDTCEPARKRIRLEAAGGGQEIEKKRKSCDSTSTQFGSQEEECNSAKRHIVNSSDTQLYEQFLNEKRKGRKFDERMNAAVMAMLNDRGLALMDALVAGGFVFPGEQSDIEMMKATEILDTDNVSLRQRKNQLNRRIRQADAWLQGKREGIHGSATVDTSE